MKCYLKNRTEQDSANLEREHGKNRVGENKEDAPQDGKTLISYLHEIEGSDPPQAGFSRKNILQKPTLRLAEQPWVGKCCGSWEESRGKEWKAETRR